jgi:hypothetical protein
MQLHIAVVVVVDGKGLVDSRPQALLLDTMAVVTVGSVHQLVLL